MAHFAKFDPRAFLESQKDVAQNAGVDPDDARHSRSLSPETLATLADRGPQHENTDVVQSSRLTIATSGKTANASCPLLKLLKLLKLSHPSRPTSKPRGARPKNERAAIAEYDGGAPRAWAEALARLDPAHPPCDIPPMRWLRFIDDCGRFLDDGWSARAEALGWGPLDLFGCDRIKPICAVRSGWSVVVDRRPEVACPHC